MPNVDDMSDEEFERYARARRRRPKGRKVTVTEYEVSEDEFQRRFGYAPADDGEEHELEEDGKAEEPEQPKAKGGARYFGR